MNGRKKIMKRCVFISPFIFQDLAKKKRKKKDDGRVGAGKAKDADNIVSISQSVAGELYGTVIDI